MDARTGWFADPIYKGHYPTSLTSLSNGVLPSFTEEELEVVKGSSDFFGLNSYTSNLIRERISYKHPRGSILTLLR